MSEIELNVDLARTFDEYVASVQWFPFWWRGKKTLSAEDMFSWCAEFNQSNWRREADNLVEPQLCRLRLNVWFTLQFGNEMAGEADDFSTLCICSLGNQLEEAIDRLNLHVIS